MPALRIVVEGRVQGVFFRAFTRDTATRLGLTGWVRNRDDGAVELEAAGAAEALDELAAAVGEGPPAARVTGVRREPLDRHPDWSDFRIVYR